MSGILDESLCYLIGAIDLTKDVGRGWRQELIDCCKNRGLHIKFLDPTRKITGLTSESTEERELILKMKHEEEWDELRTFMRRIVREDHRCVDHSDFVIAHVDPEVHTCGSYFELQSALTEKKPYFIVVKGGKKNVPAWLFGICDHNQFFGSTKEVVDRLALINNGEYPLSERWVLMRQQIKEL